MVIKKINLFFHKFLIEVNDFNLKNENYLIEIEKDY